MISTSNTQPRKKENIGENLIFIVIFRILLDINLMHVKENCSFLGYLFSANCDAGYYFNNTMGACQPCGIGFYQNLPGQDFCHQCPMGQVTKLDNSITCNDCFCKYHIYLSSNKMSPGHLTIIKLSPFICHSDSFYLSWTLCTCSSMSRRYTSHAWCCWRMHELFNWFIP